MFKKPNQRQSFPELEAEVLKFWKEANIFNKSIETKPKEKSFSFYDGPPYATGLPHYGHLLPGTIKDIIPRFKTMQGYRVERVWGWDSHGLPLEVEVEKKLSLTGKDQIEELGVAKFNEACKDIVLEYADDWKRIIERTGRWADMDNFYITMDRNYMESVWWVFKSLYDKNLIYEGYKSLPYCPRCATPLSNFETNQGFAEKKDLTVTAKFRVISGNKQLVANSNQPVYLLAWTTTPWTLPSNLALAVGEEIRYVKKKIDNKTYILAESRVGNYFPEEAGEEKENQEEDLEFLTGKDLVGLRYEPIFNHYENLKEEGAFRVVSADYVTTEDGTGIVHIAPAFGQEDADVGKKEGLPYVNPIDENGRFKEIESFMGMSVVERSTNEKIIKELGDKAFKTEVFIHNYPFCWRCDTALIYMGVPSWFVKVSEIKDQLLKNTNEAKWIPEAIKNRMLKGIEGAPDWAISRNRYWGTIIPVWKCDKCEEVEVIGSFEDLKKVFGSVPEELHKQEMDKVSWNCKCGGTMKRVPEVLDVWFDSGSMPYGRLHYPFENKEKFEKQFPADFIAEGQDQTRGWFYSMMILSTALTGKSAYKNVVVNGIVLAVDGKKMSKRLKNYPEVTEVLDKYGADAMRFYLMNSPAVRAEDLRFSEKGVEDVVKKIILTLWNTYSFFVTYANIDCFTPNLERTVLSKTWKGQSFPKNKLDRWILSELNVLTKEVTEALENYDLSRPARLLSDFLDNLSNWYVRRSRRRFWKSENDADKNEAYQTLYDCLTTYVKLLSPYMPFVTEEIYKNLTGEESVHLSDWPKINEALIDEEVNKKMAKTRAIVNFGLAARAKENIKVRQPLSKTIVFANDKVKLDEDLVQAVKDELNVKEIEFKLDDPNIVEKSVKLDFTKVGPLYGPKVKEINALVQKGEYELTPEGIKVGNVTLSEDEVLFAYSSKTDEFVVEGNGQVLVALDILVTDELKQEGMARDLVRAIQDLRKKADFDVADRINISLETESGDIRKVIAKFEDYIKKETLAEEIRVEKKEKSEKVEIEGHEIYLNLSKR